MATTGYKTIEVGHYDAGPKQEADAAATIYPGMLLERTSADKFQAHSTSGGNCQKLFAVEDDLQGNEITDAYSADDKVFARVFRPGDLVYALLADGENISKGDFLMSNGDGYLKKYAGGTITLTGIDSSLANTATLSETFPVAVAREAVNLASSSGLDATESANNFILVEIL